LQALSVVNKHIQRGIQPFQKWKFKADGAHGQGLCTCSLEYKRKLENKFKICV